MSNSGDSSSSIFIGNLSRTARISNLKPDLHRLISKRLNIHITLGDISIFNGTKRYAIVDVHNQQNVDYLLENLREPEDRKKINFSFTKVTADGLSLYVDTVKSKDEKQARDDFENAKNKRPFVKSRLFSRDHVDLGRARVIRKSEDQYSETTSPTLIPTGGRISRQSTSTTRGDNPIPSASHHSTDLDVTVEEDETLEELNMLMGEAAEDLVINKSIHMVPVADSLKEDSEDSGTQMDNMISPIEADDGEDSEGSGYEDPPGSVIDLRHISRSSMISRASMKGGKITPRIHRRASQKTASRNSRTQSSASRKDFFEFLDRQIGVPTPDTQLLSDRTNRSEVDHNFEERGTAYYKAGETIYNTDHSKEFKAYTGNYTLKHMSDKIARSICGFLNSQCNGMLLIGVQTNGLVIGIECDAQQEDRYRRHFMDAVKEIFPPVYEEDYSITYTPLLEDNGRQHPNLKVIEVRVFPPDNPELLYECKEGVYIRRAGLLVGPIQPRYIQEWIKEKHFSEMGDLRQQSSFMKDELDTKDSMIRRQADTIVAQKSEIEQQSFLLGQKSSTCVII